MPNHRRNDVTHMVAEPDINNSAINPVRAGICETLGRAEAALKKMVAHRLQYTTIRAKLMPIGYNVACQMMPLGYDIYQSAVI
jgi:hypothetical protein